MKLFLLFIVLVALLCAAGIAAAADVPKATAPIKLDELAQTKLQVLALQGQIKDLQAGKAQCEFSLAQTDRNQQAEAQKIIDEAARRAGINLTDYALDPNTRFVGRPAGGIRS